MTRCSLTPRSVLNDNRTFLNTTVPRTHIYELDQSFDIDEKHEAELAQAWEQQEQTPSPAPVNNEKENKELCSLHHHGTWSTKSS